MISRMSSIQTMRRLPGIKNVIKRDLSDSFKIYTRTGDTGSSQLFTGERRPKSDQTFAALGATDELNSHIGLAREFALDEGLDTIAEELERTMSRLFDVGAAVATPADSASKSKAERASFDDANAHAVQLESWIDAHTATLAPLKNFVLPSGGRCAAQLHVARSVCRRAEREVHPLVASNALGTDVAAYVNRLSDYLFTAARVAAKANGRPEVIWRK